jgi:hypothetical protein
MTGGSLRWAGWLAMTSALLSLPLLLFSLMNQGTNDLWVKTLDAALQVVGTALFVLLALLLRRFLGRRFNFHGIDRVIDLLIVSNLVIGLIALSVAFFPALQEAGTQVLVVALILLGILQLRFGYLFLAVPDDLGGMRRPYAYLNIATGVCLASIVLVPLAVVLSAIADVMLGTIFLQASRSIKTTV